jgi:polyhydroxyalkanoate synthesis regulator phasin
MEMNDLRKYMEATVGKLTPAKAQQAARSIVGGQAKGREQVQRVAQDLLEWSKSNRDRMTETIRREVGEQLRGMGVATRDEVDALKKRVRNLERASDAATRSTATKPSASKRATAKRTTPTSPGGTSAS